MATRLLRRDEAAQHLQSFGLRTTQASLATMASRGGGPRFLKIGRSCLYDEGELDGWIQQRCTGWLDSTSTEHGHRVEGLFARMQDVGEIPTETGQPAFDEVTRLLIEEDVFQAQMTAAIAKNDEQFN